MGSTPGQKVFVGTPQKRAMRANVSAKLSLFSYRPKNQPSLAESLTLITWGIFHIKKDFKNCLKYGIVFINMVEILQKEAPVLRMHAEPVNPKDFDSERLKKIIADMKTALEREDDGVAIAAPQIGVPLRIFIVSHRTFEFKDEAEVDEIGNTVQLPAPTKITTENKGPSIGDMVFINPEITKLSRKKVWVPEGCLSVRWLYGEVSRANKATVRAYDEHGKPFTRGAGGLLAQIFQHETDHLNGVLFTDIARNVEKITREEQERLRQEHEQSHT